MPDPDLLVRTSGEHRISNYLLWQLAYSELHFTDVLWPDFRREHLFKAIEEFQRRDRRFREVCTRFRDRSRADDVRFAGTVPCQHQLGSRWCMMGLPGDRQPPAGPTRLSPPKN